MAQNAEYKAVQVATAIQLNAELAQAALHGYKPILMTTTHAPVGPSGTGNLVITVILEHKLGE